VGEELSDQSGAGSPHLIPVEIVARSRTATPRVEHVSTIADDPISGKPDNVKQWWEELQLKEIFFCHDERGLWLSESRGL
jgi:hypothetical protein